MLHHLQNLSIKGYIITIIIYAVLQVGYLININYTFLCDIGTFRQLFIELNKLNILSVILGISLHIIGGFYLHFVVLKNEIIYKPTVLSLFFYLVISSIIINFNHISSFTIINLSSILLMSLIVKMHENPNINYLGFKAGFIIGIAAVMHIGYGIIFFFLLFAMSRYARLTLSMFFTAAIGLLFPFVCILTVNYIYPDFIQYINLNQFDVKNQNYPISEVVALSIFGFATIIGGIVWLQNSPRNTVKNRRTIYIVITYFILMTLYAAVYMSSCRQVIIILQMPSAIILAYYFSADRKMRYRNILLYLLLGVIIYFQYHHYFYI